MSLKDNFQRLREDHDIHTDIRAELKADQDIIDQGDVEITVDHGIVALDGTADSYAEKWGIEHATYRVVGVKGVHNYLEVKPPKDDYREDGEIEKAAKRALEWDARVPEGVRVEVSDSILRLHGIVSRFAQRKAAADAVRNLIGVRDVINDIQIAAANAPEDLKHDVEAALSRRFAVDARELSVTTADGVVTVMGVVPTFAMRDDIESAIWSTPGVARIDDRMEVA
jgi:osmotically-inducible protein OsmY